MVLQVAYFFLKVINYGVIQFMGNSALSVRFGAVMQVFEFIFLCGILFVFRSKPLPAFYGVGINEINVRRLNVI